MLDSFELSVHQWMLKNKMYYSFHKYSAALFSTLILIRHVSWASNQYIWLISEGSCDTLEKWCWNSALIIAVNYILTHSHIENKAAEETLKHCTLKLSGSGDNKLHLLPRRRESQQCKASLCKKLLKAPLFSELVLVSSLLVPSNGICRLLHLEFIHLFH